MKYRYEEFTWPEIRVAVAANRVAVLPVGTVEQHGPHLPLVTDVLTASEMSRLAVERDPSRAVLLPPVYYSFNEHHMDFPGTVAVAGETIINYVTDIGVSLARHGFRKILLVNGHGSNVPFLDIAARNITNRTEAVCAMVSWWSLIPKALFADLETPAPVQFQEWFSRYSRTGTVGDPTKATAEKGGKFVEAVVDRLCALLVDFQAREIRPRVDHH
jgi:creatinine amidohydrolase